jgi:hypothetical protein
MTWEEKTKALEPHRRARRARVGCNECESKDQRATAAPAKKMLRRDSLPVTLDDWHRALGFHKCVTCGVPWHHRRSRTFTTRVPIVVSGWCLEISRLARLSALAQAWPRSSSSVNSPAGAAT